eukprot:CAMPEP_0175155852 /NCGR_PEP_ID=MMETSP0087-20121206/21241_1 /TAXON_ID=136419 /ORGANISM="Unknown Unknown, Strain D1" /LENGTH=211 /DNA_ID=CAMNT_0016443125 /DNA_START=8 /DNA_END=643 /DNA_ORIENTATION=-
MSLSGFIALCVFVVAQADSGTPTVEAESSKETDESNEIITVYVHKVCAGSKRFANHLKREIQLEEDWKKSFQMRAKDYNDDISSIRGGFIGELTSNHPILDCCEDEWDELKGVMFNYSYAVDAIYGPFLWPDMAYTEKVEYCIIWLMNRIPAELPGKTKETEAEGVEVQEAEVKGAETKETETGQEKAEQENTERFVLDDLDDLSDLHEEL